MCQVSVRCHSYVPILMTMSSMHFSQTIPLFSRLILLLLLLQPALAQAQFGLGIIGELEHIGNPLRLVKPGEDELLSSITVAAQLNRQTKRFTSLFNYSLSKQEYDKDLLDDQTFLEGAGSLILDIVPDRFTWNLANTRSNQLIDISQPDIQDNRQVVDYTVTGPTVTLPLGRANFFNITAQVGMVDFAEFESLKHNRNTLSGSYTRVLNPSLTLSVQSSLTDIDYSSVKALNYDVSSAQGQLVFVNSNLSVTTVLGRQSLERAGVRSSSPIRRLDIQYRLNTRLSVSAGYADSVEDLLSDLGSPSAVDLSFANTDIQLDGNFGSTDAANIYQRIERSVGATYAVPASFSIGLRYSNNVRENLDLNNGDTDERLSASLTMPVGTRLTFNTSIDYSEQLFALDQSTFERTGIRVGVTYRINDRLSLVFSAMDSNQQDSGLDGRIGGQNISLGLSFTR